MLVSVSCHVLFGSAVQLDAVVGALAERCGAPGEGRELADPDFIRRSLLTSGDTKRHGSQQNRPAVQRLTAGGSGFDRRGG